MLRKSDVKRILIIRLSSIGDVVMTTPVAKALRAAYPDAHIAWIVEDKSRDVLEGNPYLDEVIVWDRAGTGNSPLGYLKSALHLRRELARRKFDVAIDFQGLLRSAVIARISGARRRIGYDNARENAGLFYDVRLRVKNRDLRGSEMYARMIELLGVADREMEMHVPISDEDRAFARKFIAETVSSRQAARKAVALCPATTWPHKHWTEEGWAGLSDALVSRYGAVPIFLGSRADSALIDRVRALSECDAASAAGKTSLKQAAAIIEQCDLVISVDTGLLHIANALNRPTVAVFGPTAWDYLAGKDSLAVVAKDLSCMPCFRHPTCKDHECMTSVTADEVLLAAERWLGGERTDSDG